MERVLGARLGSLLLVILLSHIISSGNVLAYRYTCNNDDDYDDNNEFVVANNSADFSTPWEGANDRCSDLGLGHLPVLDSQSAQTRFLCFLQKNNLVYWDVWLGGQKNVTRDWRWINGSAVNSSLQPSQNSTKSNHGLIRYGSNGSQFPFESNSSFNQHNFICQYEGYNSSIMKNMTEEENKDKVCYKDPEGKGRYLIAHTDTHQLPWYQARNYCLQRGGDLAYDSQFLENCGKEDFNGTNSIFWIGLSRSTWQWSYGDDMNEDIKESLILDDDLHNQGDCLCAIRDSQWLWAPCNCTSSQRQKLVVCQNTSRKSGRPYKPGQSKSLEAVTIGLMAVVVILIIVVVVLLIFLFRNSSKSTSHKPWKKHETNGHARASYSASNNPTEPESFPATEQKAGSVSTQPQTGSSNIFTIPTYPTSLQGAEGGSDRLSSSSSLPRGRLSSQGSSIPYETFIHPNTIDTVRRQSTSFPGDFEIATYVSLPGRTCAFRYDSNGYVTPLEVEQAGWKHTGNTPPEARLTGGTRLASPQQTTSPVYANNAMIHLNDQMTMRTRSREDEQRNGGKRQGHAPAGTLRNLREKTRKKLSPKKSKESEPGFFTIRERFAQGTIRPPKVSTKISHHFQMTIKLPEAERRNETQQDRQASSDTHERSHVKPSVAKDWSQSESAVGY